MRRRGFLLCAAAWLLPVFALTLSFVSPAMGQVRPQAPSGDDPRLTPVVKAVRQAAPAVVNITSVRTVHARAPFPGTPFGNFFEDLYGAPGARQAMQLGSGVVINGDRGLVLTNAHVINGAGEVKVRLLDGREFEAQVVAADPDFDVAVLRLEKASSLPVIRMADSSDLYPGETVIAIGNPFGYTHTVTTGVVSALNRAVRTEEGVYNDFIQTDAAINPGNSGGPLLNIKGELIGITTAIQDRAEGIGFAIPIAKARRVVEELLTTGRVAPVWMGVFGQNVDQRIASYFGLDRVGGMLVTEVHEDSPAERAGIRRGDLIQSVGGVRIADKDHFLEILKGRTKGETPEVVLKRTSGVVRVHPRLEPLTSVQVAELARKRWGMVPARQAHRHGVVVARVEPDSPAKRLELVPGDVLVQIGSRRLRTADDFLNAFLDYRLRNSVLIRLARGGKLYYARLNL